jgi:hypothetical protein
MNKNKQKFVPVLSNIVYHLTGKIRVKKKGAFSIFVKKGIYSDSTPKVRLSTYQIRFGL